MEKDDEISVDSIANYSALRGYYNKEGVFNASTNWTSYTKYVEEGTNFIISLYGTRNIFNIVQYASSTPTASSFINSFGSDVPNDGDTLHANFTIEKNGYIFLQNKASKGKIIELTSYKPSSDFEYSSYKNQNTQYGSPFLTKSFVVSDWKNETLTHAPDAFVDENENCYVAYYGGPSAYLEAYTNNRIRAKLSIFNFQKNTVVNTLPVMEAGESFQSFTQDKNLAPYDPVIFPFLKSKDEFLYLVLAKEQSKSSLSMQYVGRIFSKSRRQFVDRQITECRLNYFFNGNTKSVDFSESGFIQLTNDLNFNKTTYIGHPTLNGSWQRYKDEYYTVVGSIATGKGNGVPGYIVKTKNGIDYTLVTTVPSNNKNIWEGSALIRGNNLFCILRGSSNIFKYNLENGSWENSIPGILTDEDEQRHCLFEKDNRIFIIYNVKSGAKINYRNNVRILEIDPISLAVVRKIDFTAPLSFQYYNVLKNKNTWWIYFVEDRRKQVVDMKGNVSFLPLQELLGNPN
ncbi:hypothetical protein [Sphingobacterium siyangense]|uniref:hypothetical protein n=1 Tax=Sphingobacterium siyangense TaxID=459529 RepID=UPI0030190E67